MLAPVHRAWGNRVVRESVSLAEAGYQVKALMRCDQKHEAEGVIFLPAPAYKNRMQRFFILPRVLYMALVQRADIYHLHNPDMIPLAFALKVMGKTVIYDTHEDYSKRLMLRSWLPKYIRRPLGYVLSMAERLLSYCVDVTFVTQERQLPYFSNRCRVLRNAPVVSTAVINEVRERAVDLPTDTGVYRLIYAGGISRARGLFMMLDALDDLNARGISSRLWLIGPDLEQCLDSARQHTAWKYVDYLGIQPHKLVLAYMTRADVGLAVLFDEGDHASARPTKLFEYMACGLAFISSDFFLWRELSDGRGGVWIDPRSPVELLKALVLLYEDVALRKCFSQQGVEFTKVFNWGGEEQVLLAEYKRLFDF